MLRNKIEGAGGNKVSGSVLTLVPDSGATIEWDGVSPLVLSSTKSYAVTANQNSSVLIKMWGAGGACGYNHGQGITSTDREGPGGGGGYTKGTISFVSGQTYTFRIGQGGIRTTVGNGVGATYQAGGIPSNVRPDRGGTQAGGYSAIFISTTVSQSNTLLLAGGGGGGYDSDYGNTGGAGGGSSGQDAYYQQGGTGGSQSVGGLPSIYNSATAGSALAGGIASSNVAGASLGGGGGGYFGGGGGNVAGGGGGSGYFKPSSPVSGASTTTGSSSTPGNSTDASRGTSGQGGISGATGGTDGRIVLTKI